jgi:hypothetical protein
MFTHMYTLNRVFVALGLVMIFYPDFRVEAGGFAIMMVALAINWTKRRRERRALLAV